MTKITKKKTFTVQCHIVKNTLLQTAFSSILPTGIGPISMHIYYRAIRY